MSRDVLDFDAYGVGECDRLLEELAALERDRDRLRYENGEMRRTVGSHPLFMEKDTEIATLKAELAQCRELSELRLQSEQKLIAERDVLRGQVVMLEMHLENHDRLRAALEEVAALIDRDDMADTAIDDAIFILRRALGPDRAA